MNFDLRHIRYFCAVAEELHFSRAAEKLHIAQPALSRAVAQLERAMGVRLFERNNRKVALTTAGRVFLKKCYSIQELVHDSVTQAHKAGAGKLGQIVVGYTDFAIMGSLPRILKEFRQQYNDITVVPIHGVTAAQLRDLTSDKIDIGFVTGPLALPDFRCKTVQEDRLVVVLYKNHPLANQKTIRLSQLHDEPFILGNANEWRHYHNHLYHICHAAGLTVNVVQCAYNSEGIFGLVSCEMGITIHTSCARNYIRKGLVIREIDGLDYIVPTQAIWKKTSSSPVIEVFTKFIGA